MLQARRAASRRFSAVTTQMQCVEVKDKVAANRMRDAKSEHKRRWRDKYSNIQDQSKRSENRSADLPLGTLLTASRFSARARGAEPNSRSWGQANGRSKAMARMGNLSPWLKDSKLRRLRMASVRTLAETFGRYLCCFECWAVGPFAKLARAIRNSIC